MQVADMLLPEFDHETAVTRLLLERGPEPRLNWRPYARGWTLGELCLHIAGLPSWGARVLEQPAFDLTPPDGTPPLPPRVESQAETLRLFDGHVARARLSLERASDADLLARWTLRDGGRTVFTMPRVSVWRSFVMSHMVHHRGQLSVFLRLCDVPLPPIYGPTADSPGQDPSQAAAPR